MKTKAELAAMMGEFSHMHSNPETKDFALLLCENEAIAQTFIKSGHGLSIGQFAEVAGITLETVRHWVEFGLLEPYVLNGKFKFMPPHLLETRSILQWRDLGMSLEQIKSRKADGMAFVPDKAIILGSQTLEGGIVTIFAKDDPKLDAMLGKNSRTDFTNYPPTPEGLAHIAQVKTDYDQQIQLLEQAQTDLAARLEKAKTIRAKLETAQAG